MTRPLRRHRKVLASTVLGLWLFALFAGIANACSWDGVTPVHPHPAVWDHTVDGDTGHGAAPGCEDFCSNDVPMLSVLKLVQDPPAGQPLVLAAHDEFGVLPIFASVVRWARTAHPSPGVPFLLRTVRLTL
jgi:hypothetical protein